MSTRRQKRRGEPDDSGQARKRRRLVASSAGGTSEAEPVDPRENAVEEVIDLPDRSSETEVSDLTDDDSVVQQEQSQQDPRLLRAADNSAALLTNDDEEELRDSDEEELRDSDGTWPASLLRFLSWLDEDSEQWQRRPQYPRFFTAADNSAVLLMSDSEEEQGDYDDIWPAGPASSLFWVDEDSELLEEYEQQRRNVTLRGQRQSDSSVLSGNEEDEAIDDDESEDDISCPICMDFYSEILQSERLFLSTVCGHVFCSQCLPTAIEIAGTCPICRTEVTHEQYNPIFI